MTNLTHPRQIAFLFIPPIGIIIFIILFIYAASLYPGGSQKDLNTIGYDWLHNYWCNLMNKKAMNQMDNPARPFAIIGIWILSLSVWVFFLHFSKLNQRNTRMSNSVKWGGSLSMLSTLFIFSDYHDLATMLSSIFGVFAVLGIAYSLYNSNWTFFKISAVFCILLLALNNYIYYSTQLLYYLPLLQKATFIIVLTWIIALNNKISINQNIESTITKS